MSNKSLTYKDAGVDIDAGNELVARIKPLVRRTRRPEVLAGIGGFGGLLAIPPGRYREPVLVSGTDGVGTKLKLAMQLGRHDTIGIDLVAMCVNDIVVAGAEPLFFLDYYATGRLDLDVAGDVISGIARGCELAGAALVGGETAEMPGMYDTGDYDLAGFSVGIVEKDAIIDGSRVAVGDSLIGLASSGPHSNGYSLVRKLAIKPDSAFYDWLEVELARRFDFACSATAEQFRRETKAVTRAGQVKSRGERHEKDDRHRLDDRTRYVLGWSNSEKIAALEAEAAEYVERHRTERDDRGHARVVRNGRASRSCETMKGN